MSVLLLRWQGWWTRVYSALQSRRTPVASPPVRPKHCPIVCAELEAGDELGADADASIATLGEAADTPETNTRPPFPLARDPTRARTLAALDDLRQIPALQSLAREDATVQVRGARRVRQVAQALLALRGASGVEAGFDWRHLWLHALATAAIARKLEEKLRTRDDSQVYLAALLHDVGKIVLSTLAPDDYRAVLIAAWNEQGRLEALEVERLGVDHREAGLIFARRNQLPEVVQAAIAHHHDPARADAHAFEVALIALANHLSKAHDLGVSGARLDESDGEFEAHPAWQVIATQLGGEPCIEDIAAEMRTFIGRLRGDLTTACEELS